MLKKVFVLLGILILLSVSTFAIPQSINFQGRLTSSDATPINISRTVDFKLFDQQQPGGNQIGSTVSKTIIPDSNGNFSVLLDFDPSYFDGSDRYLEIQVQEGGDSAMTPRQLITAVPYAYRAIRAITAESLAGGGQGILSGSATGEILYWSGTQWETVPIGQPGQFLQLSISNIPIWGGPLYATLTTTAVSSITATTASSGGNISNNGGSPIISRGVCWNISGSPTTDNNKTTDGTGTGIFISSLTGLTAGTTYYVRAYATNSNSTAYGEQVNFKTLALATLTTTALSNITATTASSGGNISSDGGASVTSRGVCWNTSGSPTIDDSKTTNNSGTGIFASSLTGLTGHTTYYVRAYATNSVGTAYGDQLSFTTSFAIGQSYGGGIVFYVNGTGQHGLIAATSDQSSAMQWWNGSYIAIGTGTAIGTGQSNTTAIVNAQGSGSYAASICNDLVHNGYDDWFLPSKDELYQLYLQRAVVGGLAADAYWSSSEYEMYHVWWQFFLNGSQAWASKPDTYRVRAVRVF